MAMRGHAFARHSSEDVIWWCDHPRSRMAWSAGSFMLTLPCSKSDHRDLSGTADPQWQTRRAGTGAGVAVHVANPPSPLNEIMMSAQVTHQRSIGKGADLPTMGMAAEIEADPGLCRLSRKFWRVDQSKAEPVVRGFEPAQGNFSFVGVVAVHVVEANDEENRPIPPDGCALVGQDAQAHGFDRRHHLVGVVIAQREKEAVTASQPLQQDLEIAQNSGLDEGPAASHPQVAGDHAQIERPVIGRARHEIDDMAGQAMCIVEMRIGDVQDPVTVQTGRQIRSDNLQIDKPDVMRASPVMFVQASHPQSPPRHGDGRMQYQVPVAAIMPVGRTVGMPELQPGPCLMPVPTQHRVGGLPARLQRDVPLDQVQGGIAVDFHGENPIINSINT